MDTIKAGKPLCDFVKLCYTARRSVLLVGHRGTGKSEILQQAANEMGIDFICRDLSLMEPTDLVGLPKAKGRNTIYLPPEFLPRNGQGILVFEELNRCERYMRAPCLQLLTNRTLNDYRLPDGWLPVAAVNPPEDDYEVAELDPALLSRFVQARIVPDRTEWLGWARQNHIHEGVIDYVESDSTIFDHPDSNPRSWKFVSEILKAAESQETPRKSLRAAILGLVGNKRGAAFLATLKKKERPLTAEQVLGGYLKHQPLVQRWREQGHLDLMEATLLAIKKHLQPLAEYEEIQSTAKRRHNLSRFLHDLPGDLLDSAKVFFKERGYDFPKRLKVKEVRT